MIHPSPSQQEHAVGGSVCIHIGLPKTATTMLQKHLFQRHAQIAHGAIAMKFGTFDPDGATTQLITDVCRAVDWHPDLHAQAADDARGALQAEGKALVLSEESISFNGLIDHGLEAENLVDRLDRPARLKSVFPDARIIFVIRRPEDWLRAIYLQRMKGYGRKHQTYLNLSDWVQQHWEAREQTASVVSNLRYGALAHAYAEVFGHDNVFVLPFERLVEDSTEFIRELAEIIGIDADEAVRISAGQRENETLTRRQLVVGHVRAHSRIGRVLIDTPALQGVRKALARIVPGREPARPELRSQLADRISAYCADDIAALAAGWDLPLARYGYPV